MEYFDFIRPGDLDNLPEDSHLAFGEFVKMAQARLVERLHELDAHESNDWHLMLEAKHGFQNVVLGAARKFRIEPFASEDVPRVGKYDEDTYKQFRADLSNYITQIMLNAAEEDRSQSIPVREETRISLRTYVYHLREAIDKTELPEWRRDRLHEALTKFEEEITRHRIRFGVAVHVLMAVLSVSAAVGDHWDGIVKLTNNIVKELAIAKENDNEQRQISATAPARLTPPRIPQAVHNSTKAPRGDFYPQQSLDDEIPF